MKSIEKRFLSDSKLDRTIIKSMLLLPILGILLVMLGGFLAQNSFHILMNIASFIHQKAKDILK